VREILRRHCPVSGLFARGQCGNEGGNPFFQMAVEMALLEGSRVFVATERSNPSRRVVLKRQLMKRQQKEQRQQRQPKKRRRLIDGQQDPTTTADDSDDEEEEDKDEEDDEDEPVRYLYSSAVLRLLAPFDTSVAEWERSSLRANERSVLSLDGNATAAAAERYAFAAQRLLPERQSPPLCLRAEGWALAATTTTTAHVTTASSLRACCQRCLEVVVVVAGAVDNGTAAVNEVEEGGGRGSSCAAWQWSAGSLECVLHAGEVEVAPADGLGVWSGVV
jgi:hypothetical protein